MNTSVLHSLAQLFSQRMLNTAPEGVLFAGLVWVLLRMVGRQNSATRFAVWFSALAAIVALPFLAGPVFAGRGFGASHSLALVSASPHQRITLSSSWAIYLFAAWAVGSGLLLLRLSIALWQVHRLRSTCWEPDLANLDPAVAEILRNFASRCRTKLCVSSQVTAPAVIGFFQPAVVIPAWLLPQLSAEELDIILLHEAAHLRRWDHWTNLAQKIAAALFFFNPAVWWIDKRLTLEREMACDDIVLVQTASPRAYASFLISFAEKLHNARGLALVQALAGRMHQISARVTQILDTKRPGHTGYWKPVLGVSAGLLAVVIGAGPYIPTFVAVQNESSQQSRQLQTKEGSARLAADDLSRTLATPFTRKLAPVPRPRAVLASFTPRTPAEPSRVTPQGKPLVIRAKAASKGLPSQTFVVLQTRGDDASGVEVWTLCIWRVEGGKNLTERQLESAIALNL